jgi:hypothetical protein
VELKLDPYNTSTKSRDILSRKFSYSGNTSGVVTETEHLFVGGQITTSENHGGPPEPGSHNDSGGPFKTTLYEYEDCNTQIRAAAGSAEDGYRTFEGPQFARYASRNKAQWPVIPEPDDSLLDSLGTTAIALTIPTNPTVNLATTLGDLYAEGVPKLLGAQTLSNKSVKNAPSAASGDYLNWMFGWKPLLNDLHGLAKTVKDSEAILRQYRKDAGKKIKRRFDFPVETETVSVKEFESIYPTPALDTYLYGPVGSTYQRGPLYKTTTLQTKRWFEGCFRYYLPVGDDTMSSFTRHAMEADRLYGVAASPEVVWNLLPWSWLVDWKTNVGDVMTNVSAFMQDGLVMQYGYMMETTISEVTYTLHPRGGFYSVPGGAATGTTSRSNGEKPSTLSQTFRTIRKYRRPATPYGFGMDPDGFSAQQWSILAALGMTRSAPTHM